jgi:hypothetical protein
MAIYITALCTAKPKVTNDKHKFKQMTGRYKYIYFGYYCELVTKYSKDSSKYPSTALSSLLLS